MTLDQLANIGEFVSAIAVIISIIYLAIQIRQNTEAERTSTYQAVVSDFGALNNTMASNPELSHLYVRATENYHQLCTDEKARVSQLFFQCFHYFENMFYQYQKGYLDEDVWTGWKRLMLTYYAQPGFQTWWEHRRDVYSESFATFLETEKLDRKVASYHEVSNLKAELSETPEK